MNDIDIEKVGKFIASLRIKKGLKQEKLASLVNASSKTISKWENGGSFPDIIYQKPLCKVLGITLDELQSGEYNHHLRRKQKILHIYKNFSITLLIVLIPLFIILLCYFLLHKYNQKNYSLFTNSSLIYLNGIITENYRNNILYINSIKLLDYEYNELDKISIDLYSNDKVIYHLNSFDQILYYYKKKDNIDKNNLYVDIVIKNSDDKEIINLRENIYVNIDSSSISKETHTKMFNAGSSVSDQILMDNGFSKEDNAWVKEKKSKKSNVIVRIYLNNGQISYNETEGKMVYNFIYYDSLKNLEVYIYNHEYDKPVLIEKYIYNYDENKNNCQVGTCSSLKKVINIMDEYKSLLNVE